MLLLERYTPTCPLPALLLPCVVLCRTHLGAVLNVLGFACYTQFNLSLFLSPLVQTEYRMRFGTNDIPVELNDVIFGLHALIMSLVLALQCVVYPKHETQTVSLSTSLGMGAGASAAAVMAVLLAVKGEGSPPMTWLDL